MVLQLFARAKPQSSQRKTMNKFAKNLRVFAPLREIFLIPVYPGWGIGASNICI